MINIFAAFFLTPIGTRIYSKEEVGVFYIYASIVAISTLVINGMYPHAIVVPKFKRDFLALLKLCFILTFIGISIFSLFILFCGTWFLELIHGEEIGNYMYLLPLSLFLSTINIVFINWNIRRKEFKKNASSNVALSVTSKTVQIGYGTYIVGSFSGLIYAEIISKFIGTIILGAKNMVRELRYLKLIGYNDIKKAFIDFKKYPLFILPGNFMNKFTADIPLYILSSFFGIGAVGAFGFANQMLSIPYNVIGNSIAPVYFQRANELYHNNIETFQDFTKTSYYKMLYIGVLAFGFIFAFGDILFGFIFSEQWELAGQIARILSVYYIFKIIASPFTRIFRVVRKEELGLFINIIVAMLRVISIYLGVKTGDFLIAMIYFSIGNLIAYMITNMLVFKSIEMFTMKLLVKSLLIIGFVLFFFYMLRVLIFNLFNISYSGAFDLN